MSNTSIDYEITNKNVHYVERATFPIKPDFEFPAIYGNEDYEHDVEFNSAMLLANSVGGSTASANAFNFVVQSSGPPLNPDADIRIDISPGVGGGYETAVTDVVAYWDDFTNTDFVNGVANTFSGAAGFYGTITVYNHKIRWENVQWANWTQPFDLGFFNVGRGNPGNNFWANYNANTYPEQIVVYAAYGVANNTFNASYPTTEPNTAPYFVPPQANNTGGSANTSSGPEILYPAGPILEMQIINGFPDPAWQSYLPNNHPESERILDYEWDFPTNPANTADQSTFNTYYDIAPIPVWLTSTPNPAWSFSLVDGPRKDSNGNAITGEDALLELYAYRYAYNSDTFDQVTIGAVHDDGNTYNWYFGPKVIIVDPGKNYSVGDTFDVVVADTQRQSLGLPADIKARAVVTKIDAPSANSEITNISVTSSPSWVDVSVVNNNTIRVVKNQEKIWPEERFLFTGYTGGEFTPSNKYQANIAFDDAATWYANAPAEDGVFLEEWLVPFEHRPGGVPEKSTDLPGVANDLGQFTFQFTVGNTNPNAFDYPPRVYEKTYDQYFYWSTRPGLEEVVQNVIPPQPTSNTEYST